MGDWYYNWEGEPIDQMQWAQLFADERHIGEDEVGEARVSTVWMGLDHGLGLGGPPLIYETMVFGGPLDEQGERYSTEQEARRGHERWVAAVREAAGVCNGG